MPELEISFIIASFVAGILMFLAPCTLPLVPAYLAFISGVKPSDVTVSLSAKKKIIYNAVAFVLGFSVVFVLFGILAGLVGTFAGQFRELLTQVGGAFIIIFGLLMLNVISFAPLQKKYQLPSITLFTPGEPVSAGVIGVTFALGWTPCVGPVLASVLLLASTSSTVGAGAFLLGVFSLGLALPFLLVAVLYARASATIAQYARVSSWVTKIGGVFLIAIGALLLTNSFGLLVEYGYVFFGWLGFESLFNYL